jgi:hypothetical protein
MSAKGPAKTPARREYFPPREMLDINILVQTPGQERTEPEYRALLEKAGFTLTGVTPTSSAVSIVEAVPA